MRRSIRGKVLLASLCGLTSAVAWAQSPSAARRTPDSIDLALTYVRERAQIAPGSCVCFRLKGGGVDATIPGKASV